MNLIDIQTLLKECIRFLETDIITFNKKITLINSLLEKLDVAEKMPELLYKNKADIERLSEEANAKNKAVVGEIEKLQTEINEYEESIRDHTRLLEKKREVAVQIHKLKTEVKEINDYRDQINDLTGKRKESFLARVHTTVSIKKKYKEIIEVFSAHKAKVLSDLDFVAQINFDRDSFLKAAVDILDNRKVVVEGSEEASSVFNNLFGIIKALTEGDEGRIRELVMEVHKLDSELKPKIKTSSAISVSDFYNFLYANYFEVSPIVRYKKINLKWLSLGQKATVLIKIYLAQGDLPIIIDSHDDHLDNEFIMEELVNAIREAKGHRQIILVSNNGNVVINSDAEQIIIANRSDIGEISYISGSIENPTVRDRAIDVLEGGPLAFKKRQEKYRIA